MFTLWSTGSVHVIVLCLSCGHWLVWIHVLCYPVVMVSVHVICVVVYPVVTVSVHVIVLCYPVVTG